MNLRQIIKYAAGSCSFLLVPFSLLFFAACSAPKPNKTSPIIRVAMGDPQKLIEGATLTPEIPADFFDDISELQLVNIVSFDEKGEYQLIKRNLEQENSASKGPGDAVDEAMAENLLKFSVEREADDSLIMNSDALGAGLVFSKNSAAQFTLTSTISENRQDPAKLLHFSATADKRFISLLIYENHDPKIGASVTAIYFSNKIKKTPAATTDSQYYFLNGPGVKYRWAQNKTLDLDICGSAPDPFTNDVLLAQNTWNNALKTKLKINVNKTPKETRPFSDLNQRCLSVIDGYLSEPDPRAASFGMTLNVSDDEKHEFIDGDIFIMASEFKKANVDMMNPAYDQTRKITVLHEMGHLLGLDHQFDGPVSIMGYDFSLTPMLYDYDQAAISALYAD
ncbi:MAG: hypothetical protein KDD38_05505 [Bdellovibrionales bacterium]|nr:hypothetical protein [Bdellovibrionales bacterium]